MTTKEMIDVMQAFEDGKEIECRDCFGGTKWVINSSPTWDWYNYDYRISTQPKYRPYESVSEMLNDYKQNINDNNPYSEINIWVVTKSGYYTYAITGFNLTGQSSEKCLKINEKWVSLKEAFALYNYYLNDKPLGMIDEVE